MPAATARNEVHVPSGLFVRPTCFNAPMAGCAAFTVNDPDAVFPFTVAALMTCETLPLVLLYVPTTGAVTLTVTVQAPPPAIVPPEKLTEPAPAAGAKVGAPQPETDAAGAAATTIAPGEVGKTSLNATEFSASF